MKNNFSKIDHIVLAVPNLEEGIDWIEKKLGSRPIYGGQHLTEGTHNALLNLGNECYLELLAIDFENKNINPPRWMGIDLIDQPTITRWAIKSTDLLNEIKFLENVNTLLGNYKSGMREKADGSILSWQLSIPLPNPSIEIAPFLIDWGNSTHPTFNLKEECKLVHFELFHPEPADYQQVINELNIGLDIRKASEAKISIVIQSPNGLVELT